MLDKPKLNCRGFSFIEVMIAISLFILLAGVGTGAYFGYYQRALVNSDIQKTLTLIKQARFRALKNPDNSNYGIRLDAATQTVTSFRDTYSPVAPDNVVLELEQLGITNLNLLPTLGVTNDIIFEKQTGKTQNTGSFTISNINFSFTYSINSQGVVN